MRIVQTPEHYVMWPAWGIDVVQGQDRTGLILDSFVLLTYPSGVLGENGARHAVPCQIRSSYLIRRIKQWNIYLSDGRSEADITKSKKLQYSVWFANGNGLCVTFGADWSRECMNQSVALENALTNCAFSCKSKATPAHILHHVSREFIHQTWVHLYQLISMHSCLSAHPGTKLPHNCSSVQRRNSVTGNWPIPATAPWSTRGVHVIINITTEKVNY